MSDQLKKSYKRFEEEIGTVKAHLEQVACHVESGTEHVVDVLARRQKEAEAKCDASREHARQAGLRIKHFLEEKKDAAVSRFDDWKTDRDIAKLEKHADRSEQQALDAIALAAFAIMEAEIALMEALKVRNIAIEVAG